MSEDFGDDNIILQISFIIFTIFILIIIKCSDNTSKVASYKTTDLYDDHQSFTVQKLSGASHLSSCYMITFLINILYYYC